MIFELLALAAKVAGGAPAATTPIAATADVGTHDAGLCGVDGLLVTPASVAISWGIQNADDSLYKTQLILDGYVLAEVPSSTTSYIHTVPGVVEYGPSGQYQITWQIRVDVVRISNGTPVSTTTSNTFTQTYGRCASGQGGI